MDANLLNTTYRMPCLSKGYTTTVGPFPAGTRMGFYHITNGKGRWHNLRYSFFTNKKK